MKIIRKYLHILVLTVVFLYAAVHFMPEAVKSPMRFAVKNPITSEKQEISLYRTSDRNCYVFLPSYAELDMVTISIPQDQLFFVGDYPLSDGMNCGNFALETPYDVTLANQKIATLYFLRSENVSTLYLDTASGNMNYIHQNKEHEETVSVRLYDVDGSLDFSDERSVLNGRGNYTWEQDKRPYTLTLPTDYSLLDMGAATKWTLLANATDETNLNNKLVFDLAERIGFSWTPESRWVDLYLNGEYNGLYLLAEKVEVHENRLDLNADSGDFLCKFDLLIRLSTLRNPYISEEGSTVEIDYPANPTEEQWTKITSRIHELEQEIRSGKDLLKSSSLNLDSWVRQYLIDEIFANLDADMASSYFYCSGETIYAGPLWDYDMALGNSERNQDPYAFIAKTPNKDHQYFSKHYHALYQNESFYQRLVELYRTEFLPELQKLLDGELDRLITCISKASQSNSLRWRSMYDRLPANIVHTPAALKDYLSSRVQFLSSAWLKNTPYCTVQFEPSPGAAYLTVAVEKGHRLRSAFIDTETEIWVNSETGEIFDFRQPITTDLLLFSQSSVNARLQPPKDEYTTPVNVLSIEEIVLFSVFLLLIMLVIHFAIIDISHRRKKKISTSFAAEDHSL